ncbi:MAG: signal peptidase I [Chloroflexota bacterium]
MRFDDGLATWTRRGLDVALIVLVVVCLFGVFLGRIVPLTGRTTLVVSGGSMEPTLPVGAAIIDESVPSSELAVGQIVSLRSGPGRAIFTHRIIRVAERDGERWIETQGDANPKADPSLTAASAVIGRETLVIPYAGFLIALLSIPSGIALVFSLGLVLLAAAWLVEGLEGERVRAPGWVREPARRRELV